MMEDLREFSPGAGKVLIDERDQFIASKIQSIGQGKESSGSLRCWTPLRRRGYNQKSEGN